jgi:hypothetical protein
MDRNWEYLSPWPKKFSPGPSESPRIPLDKRGFLNIIPLTSALNPKGLGEDKPNLLAISITPAPLPSQDIKIRFRPGNGPRFLYLLADLY